MHTGTKLHILWYTKPSIKSYLGFLLLMGGFLGMMAFLHARGQMDETSWSIFRWVGGGMILAVLLPYWGGYLRILLVFRRADKKNQLDELCEDFDRAEIIAHGYARMGKTWFFGKGGRNIVPYADICQVRLYENYAGFQRNQRELHYVDTRGREHPLCGLPLFGKKGSSIAQEITSALVEKRGYPDYPASIHEPSHGGR